MKKFFTSTPLHRLFFYLTVICVPIQLGIHFWPSWAMVLGRRVDYLSPILYLTDIFMIATVVCWTVSELRKRKHPHFHPLLFVCAFVAFVNIAFSKNISVSLYQWIKITELAIFGLYIVKTKPAFKHLTIALAIAVFYPSIIAIIQFILQRSIGGPFYLMGERTFFSDSPGIAQLNLCDLSGQSCRLLLRPYGTFPHPNVLGGFLAITLPFLLFFLIQGEKQISGKLRYLILASFAIGVCALVVTFSRSAWIAGTLGILFVLHTTLRASKNVWYRTYMKMIFAVAFVFAALCAYFLSKNLSQTESVFVRGELNIAAFQMIMSNPIFGVGWGNFLTALPFHLSSRTIYFLQPVHNLYLLAAAQLGFVGVIFILFLIIRFAKRVREINPVIGASFFLILLLGLVDHYFLTLQQGQLILAIITGMFVATSKNIKNPHTT